MARTQGKATVNNFVGGLVSDFHELNQPQNTTVDEDNCDLDRKGSRKRRLGIDYENGFTLSDDSWALNTFGTFYTKASTWESVENNGNRNFLVVQVGNMLYFYDLAIEPLSSGILPFTVNLDDFRVPSYYTTSPYEANVASGKGALFVVGEAFEPFYIKYDVDANDITTTQLTLKIRDLDLQDHDMGLTDQFTTLTIQQKYDLFNQGWYSKCPAAGDPNSPTDGEPVFDWYFHKKHKYPQKAKSWWVGKRVGISTGATIFDPTEYDTVYVGSTLAPLGSYILDAFNQDRSKASGIAGLPVVQESSRPTSVAFASGRVFYGFKNKLYFSQVIIDDFTVAEYCYQEADPTAEKINDLIATDGGVVPLQASGNIVAMVPFENSLIVFSTNGVWAVSGSTMGQGFSADGFSIYKITSVGAISSRSVISVDGTPCWWAKIGIFILQSDPAKQGFAVQNILKDKLQLYYDAIPGASKLYATGAYDRRKKVITWAYNSGTDPIDGNPYFCDRLLNYDLILSAFYPYTLAELPTNTPRVADVFALYDVSQSTEEENVVDESGAIVVDEALDDVTTDVIIIGNFDNELNIGIKFLTFAKEIVGG